MSLNAWPSHKMELYDGWILRFSYFIRIVPTVWNSSAPPRFPGEKRYLYVSRRAVCVHHHSNIIYSNQNGCKIANNCTVCFYPLKQSLHSKSICSAVAHLDLIALPVKTFCQHLYISISKKIGGKAMTAVCNTIPKTCHYCHNNTSRNQYTPFKNEFIVFL